VYAGVSFQAQIRAGSLPRRRRQPSVCLASAMHVSGAGRRITSDRFLTKERSMRKTFILTLVLCVAAAIAYAQAPAAGAAAGTGSSTSAATGSTGTTTTPAKKSHAAAHSVKGSVASVDATAKSFVVHPATGADVTLKVNDKTTYWVGKKKGTWDDVKVGANVKSSYHPDGTDNWALAVHISAAMATPAAKTGK
jgi:hypothetical protein